MNEKREYSAALMAVAFICNSKKNYLAKLDTLRAQRSLKHAKLIPT
jgi:hypothetical protein